MSRFICGLNKAKLGLGILTASAILTGSCSHHERSVKVTDVRQEEVMAIEKVGGSGNVHALRIEGSGRVDGEATLMLMLDGKPYKTETLKDDVKFSWDGDWYSDTAEIRYVPVEVNSGDLVLKYQFSTF